MDGRSGATADRPGMWRATSRLRCPACGEGRLFTSPFALRESCATCGLDFVGRAGAQYGGAMALGYGVGGTVGIAVFIVLVAWLGYADWMVWAAIAALVLTILASFRYCKAWWTWWLFRTGQLGGARRG